MATEAYLVKCDIRQSNHIFHKSIRQVALLNEQIVSLKSRYERACRDERKTLRYTLRLRLAAIEGTRNVYYQFAERKVELIDDLQNTLRSLTGEEYDFQDEDSNFQNESSYQSFSELFC